MKEFKGRVAVVTGAASGIGYALAKVFAREGMKVVLSDIRQDQLDSARDKLVAAGFHGEHLLALQCDVTSVESVERLAQASYDKFGVVHILCNNAGVGLGESKKHLWELAAADWEWGFAVNTFGAVNGIRAFVPRMIAGGEEGLVINTSSGNGGLTPLPTTPIYASSKAALTSLTEVLHHQLLKAGSKVRAALLFPGPHVVNTGILDSSESRPSRYQSRSAEETKGYKSFADLAKGAGVSMQLTEPAEVAEYTLDAIYEGKFWILPESQRQDEKLKARTESILRRDNPSL